MHLTACAPGFLVGGAPSDYWEEHLMRMWRSAEWNGEWNTKESWDGRLVGKPRWGPELSQYQQKLRGRCSFGQRYYVKYNCQNKWRFERGNYQYGSSLRWVDVHAISKISIYNRGIRYSLDTWGLEIYFYLKLLIL